MNKNLTLEQLRAKKENLLAEVKRIDEEKATLLAMIGQMRATIHRMPYEKTTLYQQISDLRTAIQMRQDEKEEDEVLEWNHVPHPPVIGLSAEEVSRINPRTLKDD